MKYVLMFCDTPELYGEVDEVAAKAVHEEIWAWFGEHDAAGRIADMGAHLQPVTTATTVKSGRRRTGRGRRPVLGGQGGRRRLHRRSTCRTSTPRWRWPAPGRR